MASVSRLIEDYEPEFIYAQNNGGDFGGGGTGNVRLLERHLNQPSRLSSGAAEADEKATMDLGKTPITANTRFAAGQMAESEGNYSAAVVQYQYAVKLNPKHNWRCTAWASSLRNSSNWIRRSAPGSST